MGHRSCALCGWDEALLLFCPRSAPGPVVRCQRCGLVCVSPVEDDRALIDGGPPVGGLDPEVLTSEKQSWTSRYLLGRPACLADAFVRRVGLLDKAISVNGGDMAAAVPAGEGEVSYSCLLAHPRRSLGALHCDC